MRDKIEVFVGPYSLLVFDEAQKIKNPGALVSEMAKSIKTEFCLALTGTPVENSLRDLVSIVDRVQPTRKHKLLRFVENYEAIERGGKPTFGPYPEEIQCPNTNCGNSAGQHEESEETYDKETFLQKIKEELECATPPVILRRLKDTHWNERPEKTIRPPYEDIMVTEDDDGEGAKNGKKLPTRPKLPVIAPESRKERQRESSTTNNLSSPSNRLSAILESLPPLEGVTYQQVTAQDGRPCIIATGNTQAKKELLTGSGFRWNPQRKLWWKYVDAA